MTTPREEARAWIQRALVSAFPQNSPDELAAFGDSVFVIAEQHQIPTESVVFWIHDHPTGKDWSLGSWRGWCERYAALRAQVGDDTPPTSPEDFSVSQRLMCRRCWSNELQRIDGGQTLWCAKCGEVQQ